MAFPGGACPRPGLWHELRALGLPVICIDAGHVKAALSLQINKSDRNDAVGLARIMQHGWYKEVQVKSVSCHDVRAIAEVNSTTVPALLTDLLTNPK